MVLFLRLSYFLILILAISLIFPSHIQLEETVLASSAIDDDERESISPIFDRQEIFDNKEDLLNMTTAKRGIGSNYIDINSVTYSSDGRFLNATLWLSSFTEKPARNEVYYGVLVDADLDNSTGFQGVDYKAEIAWNRSETKWKKTFGEFSSGRNERSIEQPFNITASSDKDKDEKYIKLDLDLNSILTPEKYKLFFYAYANPPLDPSTNKTKGSGILDAVRWAYVPPPEFTISTEPKDVTMMAGEEEKEILVQVDSTTGLEPTVALDPMIPSDNILMNLTEKNLSLPSFGISTTHLKIKADKPTLQRFFITGNLSFPPEEFTIPINKPTGTSGNVTNITIPILSKNVQKQASILLNISEPLSPSEQIRLWILDWVTPVSAVVTLVISAVTGIIGWRIGIKKSKQNIQGNIAADGTSSVDRSVGRSIK